MTAQDLLDKLTALSASGVDLTKLDVVAQYTEFDYSIPYDIGIPATVYLNDVQVDSTNELRLV